MSPGLSFKVYVSNNRHACSKTDHIKAKPSKIIDDIFLVAGLHANLQVFLSKNQRNHEEMKVGYQNLKSKKRTHPAQCTGLKLCIENKDAGTFPLQVTPEHNIC
jgi:hypothetical protein